MSRIDVMIFNWWHHFNEMKIVVKMFTSKCFSSVDLNPKLCCCLYLTLDSHLYEIFAFACLKFDKMKIFQLIQKTFEASGIRRAQAHKKHPFNKKNSTIYLFLIQFTISVHLFLIFQAETFREYADSFFMCMSTIFVFVCFMVTLWKQKNIFDLIDDFEDIIERRRMKIFSISWKDSYYKRENKLKY